jgi:hypothetical protein
VAVTYDVSNHERLSEEAQQLDPDVLAFENEIAELQLGIADTGYTGVEADRLKMAIVLQVNDNVARTGAGAAKAAFLQSETRGPMSVSYRDIADARATNQTALDIVQKVLAGDVSSASEASAYVDMRSVRFHNTRSL